MFTPLVLAPYKDKVEALSLANGEVLKPIFINNQLIRLTIKHYLI